MPLLCSLDTLVFDNLYGVLQPLENELEKLTRPGHDYETIRLLGLRGVEHTVTSRRYFVDKTACRDAVAIYVSFKDGNAYEVFQHGVSFGHFKVLDVKIRDIFPALIAGSITPNCTHCLDVDWLLVATPSP